jgi:hypothetical protein
VGTVDGRPAFGVNYPNVGYYDFQTNKLNSFQLVLIGRADTGPGNFDIELNYARIQWETGDASDGSDGLGGFPARVGYSNGTGVAGTFFELTGSGESGSFLDSNAARGLRNNSLGSRVLGRYVFQVRNGVVNQPPTAGDDAVTAVQGTPLTIPATSLLANDSDPEGASLSITGVSAASAMGGTVTFDPALGVTYTPPAGFSGTDTFTYSVTDGIGTSAGTVTVRVLEVNQSPVLAPIGNKSVDELTSLSFVIAATDADSPANTLNYSAVGLPVGAGFTPATRTFSWTPTEAQGPGSYNVTFTVSDGGLLASETITITVNEVNAAPVLAPIGNKSVAEGDLLSLTPIATDPDLPANALTFSLIGAPTGTAIDPSTGLFTWTPTEAQGPGSYTFTVRVTDNGSPSLFDEEQITVAVNEVNRPPVLAGVPASATVDVLATLSFTATASDPDLPANTLTFSLIGAPTGAAIDPSTGLFTWTPTQAQGSGSYTFTVRVTDNGSPALFDEKPITVTVNAEPAERTVSIDIKPGETPNTINRRSQGNVPVTLFGSATFDVTQVDLSSLTFGRTGDERSLLVKNNGTYQVSFEDVNHDGYLDLVMHFDTQLTGFQLGDTVGILKGKLRNGKKFKGTDSVRILE